MTQSGPTEGYDFQRTAKHDITSYAARHGWGVRDDGDAGVMTDYIKPGRLIRVHYDAVGRVRSVYLEVRGQDPQMIPRAVASKKTAVLIWLDQFS